MSKVVALILAAGIGKRMKSDIPKVLQKVAGIPMLKYVMDSVSPIVERLAVVVGHKRDLVEEYLSGMDVNIVVQSFPKGTGDAVISARDYLEEFGYAFILPGDVPLLKTENLRKMKEVLFEDGGCDLVFATFLTQNPEGYGRVIRDSDGRVMAIVEDKDATEEQRAVREVNAGIYFGKVSAILEALELIGNDNVQKEYYLTDIVRVLYNKGCNLKTVNFEQEEVMGVNDKRDLAVASSIVRKRILDRLMVEDGVIIVDPSTTHIDGDVHIGRDTVIHPFTFIHGKSLIGDRCEIGPMVKIVNCRIGNGVLIRENCTLEGSELEDNVKVGPFAYIRPDVIVKEGAFVGKFVEVKKSVIGRGSKVPHLSYIGDATIGDGVNIGAGTITCNYDGEKKNPTFIGDGVFIGSDTMLVAPVKIGEYSYTGAGSVITKDVPPYSLGIARVRQSNIVGWTLRRKKKK